MRPSINNNKSLIIGFNLLYIPPGYYGGTVRYAFSLFKEMIKISDFEWHLYVRKGVIIPPELTNKNIHIHKIKIKGSLVGRVLYEQFFLPIRVCRDSVNLLFSPGFVTPLWGSFKKVITIHDFYFKNCPEYLRFWQRQYWRVFISLSIYSADLIITVSKETNKDLVKFFPSYSNNSLCIYPGVEESSYPYNDTVTPLIPYCLVVGNITPNKNIKTVLKAIELVNKGGNRCLLKVIGQDVNGELNRHLQYFYNHDLIIFQSNISDKKLQKAYHDALCTIQASTYEGFGLPIIEAMSIGSPVVVSDIEVLLEVSGSAALSFNRDSPGELSDIIKRLLMEEGLRAYLKEKGYRRAKFFSWSKSAEETIKVFQSIFNSKKV